MLNLNTFNQINDDNHYDILGRVRTMGVNHKDLENYKIVYNSKTKKNYSIVNDTYTPINNIDVFGDVIGKLSKLGLDPKLSIYQYKNGASTAIRAKISQKSRIIQQGDNPNNTTKLMPEFWLYNSYDTTQKARLSLSVFDNICSNGMAFKNWLNFYNVKHSPNGINKVGVDPDKLLEGLDMVGRQFDLIQDWAKKVITYDTAQSLLKSLSGMNTKSTDPNKKRDRINNYDRILEQVQTEERTRGGLTLWALVSGVTQYSTLRATKGGLNTNSLKVGVDRQEAVANWLSRVIEPAYS